MKIESLELYTPRSVRRQDPSAPQESYYWGGGGLMRAPTATVMSRFPEYETDRMSWTGQGQDPFAIKIITDSGEEGVCANYGGGQFACQVIDKHFRRFLIGENPFNIELIWEKLWRASSTYGRGGITAMAMSGVDLALWDLLGKVTQQPVYNLIGGSTKENVPCYATVHVLENVEAMVSHDFAGYKLVSYWGAHSGEAGLDALEAQFSQARDLVGPRPDLMLECYQSMDLHYATRVAERLKPYNVRWIEDPLMAGYATKLNRELRRRITPTQLAVGNLEYDVSAFHETLRAGACDVIQPEVAWVGGLTATRRISAMARPYATPVIPHGGGVYTYHFVAAETSCPFAEYVVTGDGTEIRPVLDLVIGEPLPKNGTVTLSDAPGFGVELNFDALEPYESS